VNETQTVPRFPFTDKRQGGSRGRLRSGRPLRPRPILPISTPAVYAGSATADAATDRIAVRPPGAARNGKSLAILQAVPGEIHMTTLSIAKKHHLSHKNAKAAAQKVADDLRDRFALHYTWRGDSIAFERPGLVGEMHVGRSEVRLDCELGLLLSLLKPKLEAEINKEFDKRFGKPKA